MQISKKRTAGIILLLIAGCVSPFVVREYRAEARLKAADRLREAGKIDEAIAAYSEAIAIEASDERSFNNRGLAYVQKGDYGKAVADFSEAIRLAPYYPLAYENRSLVYEKLGDYQNAEADATAGRRVRKQYEGP